jgi:hypothetical protein
MEDLNYLFHRQQQERSRAAAASCAEAREAHGSLAEFYENRIRDLTHGRITIVPPTRLRA